MTAEEMEAAKVRLRAEVLTRRGGLSATFRADASQRVANLFFSQIPVEGDMVVAGYWPIRDELDCRPILIGLMDDRQPVCLPVVQGAAQPLQMRLWAEGAPLNPAGFGTLAPADSAPLVEPGMVLVPLLGFDGRGTRLGYGGGYYDRTLGTYAHRPLLVGLAFATQELDEIPRDVHDVPLDYVITEKGVRRFGGMAG